MKDLGCDGPSGRNGDHSFRRRRRRLIGYGGMYKVAVFDAIETERIRVLQSEIRGRKDSADISGSDSTHTMLRQECLTCEKIVVVECEISY